MTAAARESPRAHVLGSVALDRIYGVDRLPGHDDKAFIRSYAETAGGPPLRLAMALAGWGVTTGLAAIVGDDEVGAAIVRQLGAKGLDTTAIERRSGLRTPANIIIVDDTGERAILIEPVAEDVLSAVGRTLAPKRGDAVVANLFHPGAVGHAFAKAREVGALTLLDLELPELDRWGFDRAMELLPLVDILCTNGQVLAWWQTRQGLAGGHIEMALDLARALSRGMRSVCVTLGADGVVAVDAASAFHVPALDVEARDTTGAGDTFAAALIKGRLADAPLATAVALGTVAAGLFVSEGPTAWSRIETEAAAVPITSFGAPAPQ